MSFSDAIRKLSERASKFSENIQSEEATKNALVMPMISALGYDVFNPDEIIPEYTSDVGTKKGEKVDYAIKINGKISILIECKKFNDDLSLKHASQLYRYFSVTDVKFAILTNGVDYHFYSDLENENKMDDRPFFKYNITKYDDNKIGELKKFSKDIFDVNKIMGSASTLKYMNLVGSYFLHQMENVDEDFSKFIGRKVYPGRMSAPVVEDFQVIVKRALDKIVRDRVNERIKLALDTNKEEVDEEVGSSDDEIITTDMEILGFNIIKAIAASETPADNIHIRDAKSYCAILYGDNNRKTIARLHFNGKKKKYIGIFTNGTEEKFEIDDVESIYNHSDSIRNTVRDYLNDSI